VDAYACSFSEQGTPRLLMARHRMHTEATVVRMNRDSKNRSSTIMSISSGRWSMVHVVVSVVVAPSLIMTLLDDVADVPSPARALLADTLALRRCSFPPATGTGSFDMAAASPSLLPSAALMAATLALRLGAGPLAPGLAAGSFGMAPRGNVDRGVVFEFPHSCEIEGLKADSSIHCLDYPHRPPR
jgi:hypothetical protein